MKGKFLLGLHEYFSRFWEDVFYRDGQRKPEDPPLPRQRTNWSKNLRADQDLEPSLTEIFFSVAASSNIIVRYAQLQARLADVVTKLITLQASVDRLP